MEVKIIKELTACFTGHRYLPAEQAGVISCRLEKTLTAYIEKGYRYFGAGGALGFDTLAAQTVLKLKEKYPYIRLILVLPCRSQTKGWRQDDMALYEDIKLQADKVVYTAEAYTQGCMLKRNRYLVDNSSLCICYFTGKSGGTAYTVHYANKQGVDVVNLAK